jgi:hypothetical protein
MRRVTQALLFLVAIAAGLGGGLFYTWVLDPVEHDDVAPDSLYIEDKLVYLALIGDLYAYDQDLTAAKARLAELDVKANGQAVADLIEQYLDGGGQPEAVRNLARLAADLGASGGVLLVFGSMPTPSPAFTPTTAILPAASPTPLMSATPAPSFRLIEQTAVCADPGQPGKIMIWVRDLEGNEVAGVEVVASWATGEDRLYTGLRPDLGAGYADFDMSPRVEYDVALVGFRGDVAQGLTADLSPGTCPAGTQALDWRLIFQQMP